MQDFLTSIGYVVAFVLGGYFAVILRTEKVSRPDQATFCVQCGRVMHYDKDQVYIDAEIGQLCRKCAPPSLTGDF
jgi:hypothetical protein